MDDDEQRVELRRFLKDRRGRLDPAEVGLPTIGRRRVKGLRREEVALLAGIGVSWYTALESGEAKNASRATIIAVSDALRLSESERNYLLTLTGAAPVAENADTTGGANRLIAEVMLALQYPAYIITASWDVPSCNDAFRRVWSIREGELPFNAVERLFVDPRARAMHGDHFITNVTPVIAMLRSSVGRRPHHPTLQRIRDLLLADEALRDIWNGYEVSDPLIPNRCTIESAIGTFTYEALTLANPGETSGIVVQIPDPPSRQKLSLQRNRVAHSA